jgi:phage shock protein PspC (stress-responsive transcriptional regulator)
MDTAPDTDTDTTTTTTSTGSAGSTGDERPPAITGGPMYATGPGSDPAEHLHRSGQDRMLAGVAGGLADYFDVDPTLVRIGFVALAFLGGLAVPLYLAGWLLIPEEGTGQSVAEELLERERIR